MICGSHHEILSRSSADLFLSLGATLRVNLFFVVLMLPLLSLQLPSNFWTPYLVVDGRNGSCISCLWSAVDEVTPSRDPVGDGLGLSVFLDLFFHILCPAK